MTNEKTDDTVGDEHGTDPADAFGALSDPLRVDILQTLAAHHRETDGGESIGFAELRRAVDVRDSGRFRYHVERLRGRFVEKTDEGYHLTYAGVEVVAAILMGTYTEQVSRGPEDLDSVCFVCEESAMATYENGHCLVTCANSHPLFQWAIPPSAAADTTLPEIVDVAELLAYQAIERALAGICPRCYQHLETEVLVNETARPGFRAECEACGMRLIGPVGFCLLIDPQVAAFYRRHGRELREHYIWEHSFVQDEASSTVTEDSSVRVEIDVCVDEETLKVIVDETGHVVTHRTVEE
jgi:DNA-binding transcriptional ArsR family regulator